MPGEYMAPLCEMSRVGAGVTNEKNDEKWRQGADGS